MLKHSMLVAVLVLGMPLAAAACEQHGDHAALKTASVTPAPKPELIPPAAPAALRSAPLAVEEAMTAVPAAPDYAARGGCMRGQKTEQTVVLTD
jgi:hypothetical protein